MHVGSMYWAPMQRVLGVAPVTLGTWAVLFGLALTVALAMELHKWSWARRAGRRPVGVAPDGGHR